MHHQRCRPMGPLTVALALLLLPAVSWAAPKDCADSPIAMIVFDRSGSMRNNVGGKSKYAIAQNAVEMMTTNFNTALAFGLNVYPGSGSCTTGKTVVQPAIRNADAVKKELAKYRPSGSTPMGRTLTALRARLQQSMAQTGKLHYVILITDGRETCSGNPVGAVRALAQAGIDTYVVGFGSGVSASTLGAMAREGNTQKYHQADDEAALKQVLQAIGNKISCCGNGALDTGELCDTGIAVGQAGACPATCDDGDPGTKDTKVGQDCQQQCAYEALCGNGTVDPGERCDTAIAKGQAGACPTAADCDDKDPCTNDGLEQDKCQAVCVNRTIPSKIEGSDGCCPVGHSSWTDADCPIPCGPDPIAGCVNLCEDVNCSDGKVCQLGECVEPGAGPSADFRLGRQPDAGVAADSGNPTHQLGGTAGAGGCGVAPEGQGFWVVLLLSALLCRSRPGPRSRGRRRC